MEWPPSSSDLNAIETVWHRIKQRIRCRTERPTSVAELKVLVEEEFYSITREEIRDIVGTTADRMSAVVRARGTGTRCIRNCRGVFFFIFYRKKLVWSLFLCRKIVFVAHFVQESIFHFFGHLFRKKSAFKNHDSSLLTIYVSSCEELSYDPCKPYYFP